MKVYLDNASTTPMDPQVLEAMMPYFTESYGNPSAIHGMGRKNRAAIETARKQVAEHFKASTSEIFFTSCGTEANNMVIKCAVRDLGVTHIITTAMEHHCVLYSVECMDKLDGISVSYVNVDSKGFVDYDHLDELLQKGGKTLVTLMHANNEIGTLMDLKRVGEICKTHNAYFHSDTVQTIGHYPIDSTDLNIHFFSGSAHKFYGPKGVGFLYMSAETQIQPFITGGSQERNMRAGTENLYGIIGMAKALDLVCGHMTEEHAQIAAIKTKFKNELIENIPGVEFNGDADGGLYTVLSASFDSIMGGQMLLTNLDMKGICASSGSACSSGSSVGSHVLQAIKADPNRTTIRFSFSKHTTAEEIDYTVNSLKEIFKLMEAEV